MIRLTPQPPQAGPLEQVLWRVRKDAREAKARLKLYPFGQELIVTVGDQLMWSRLWKNGEDFNEIRGMSEGCLADFKRVGWRQLIELPPPAS